MEERRADVLTEQIFKELLREGLEEQNTRTDEALHQQRKEIFKYMGEFVGYDLGDPSDLREFRDDLGLLRKARKRSERFSANTEKFFTVLIYGGGSSLVIGGIIYFLSQKLGIGVK